MKKILAVMAVLMTVAGLAFAGGSTNAKDKVYADCLVNVPKVCGGAQNVNWSDPVESQKFRDCTQPKYQECYRVFTQGK